MRETTKEVVHEVDGNQMVFQIKKMDALHGTYLIKFCTEKLLPIFADVKNIFVETAAKDGEDEQALVQARTAKVLEMIPKALAGLSEEELINFEIRCLNTVSAILPAGPHPVMQGKNFGIPEVEEDAILALLLCYEVVEFNMGSFFGGKNLGSVLQSLSSSRSNA